MLILDLRFPDAGRGSDRERGKAAVINAGTFLVRLVFVNSETRLRLGQIQLDVF